MKCPKCESAGLQVLDSRPHEDCNSVKRRKFCPGCNYKFSTFEIIQDNEYDLTLELLSVGNQFPIRTIFKGNIKDRINLSPDEVIRIKKSLSTLQATLGLAKE